MSHRMHTLWAAAVVALPCLASPALAQVRVGPIVDLNVADVSLDADELAGIETSSIMRWGIGARADLDVTSNLALSVSPMYLGKGYEAEIPPGGEDVRSAKAKLGYLEIPVELRYSLGYGDVRPYLFAGPRIGFLTGGTATIEYVDGVTEEEDLKDETKSVDLGVAGGIGVGFPVTHSARGFVEALYAASLTNANDDSDAPNDSIKNRGFQVRAGVTFGFD